MAPRPDSFAARLKAQLAPVGLNQAHLARRMNISPQAVNNWLRSEELVPRVGTVAQVAFALGVDPSVLGLVGTGPRIRPDALAGVPGLHVAYLAVALKALWRARDAISRLTPTEALEPAFGKGDSTRVDVMAEHSIVATLSAFDNRACILSEERGVVCPVPRHAEILTWCTDPLDRSRVLHELLRGTRAPTLGDLFVSPEYTLRGASAASGAIAAVAHGEVLFSCILDYGTGHLYVAFPELVVSCPVAQARTPEELVAHASPLVLAEGDENACGVVTFLGDSKEARHAQRKRVFSALSGSAWPVPRGENATPGGPGRILYLCDDVGINGGDVAGVVMASGERLGEWVHWLPFVTHSRGVLAAYELWCSEFHADVLLAPPRGYSVIVGASPTGVQIDIPRLMALPAPHHYRAGLAIVRTGSTFDANLRSLKNHRRIGTGS